MRAPQCRAASLQLLWKPGDGGAERWMRGRGAQCGGLTSPRVLVRAQESDWSSALYKALEHAQRTLQTKIEELHVQRSRLGAHDDLIEVTKKNVAEESNQLQTELKAKIGEVRDARSACRQLLAA